MPKEMLFQDEARRAIFAGVAKLARAVKATLGPTGRNVVIKKKGRPPFITKDGVTVAREVVLTDEFENLGAELVREVASKTADAAGDGTTTATVLAEAILSNGARHLVNGVNATELKRGIDTAVKVVLEQLDALAKPVKSKDEMYQVACISSNGDEHVAKLLSDLIDEIGSDGVATIEKSGSSETFVERVDGLQLSSGYVSELFKTTETGEAVWDDPRILIYSGRIAAARDLILGNGTGFLERALTSGEGRPIVIICDGVDGEALHALIINRVQGGQKILAVKAPFSINKTESLDDIALITGGKVFSKEAGHKLHKIDLEELGSAKRVLATKHKTLILGGDGDPAAIEATVKALQEKAAEEQDESLKKALRERAAKLRAGVAVIRVGGASEVEYKERHDRIEDALFSTQAAVDEGIVPGGGTALVRCIKGVQELAKKLTGDMLLGATIIEHALSAPLCQIAENAGITGEVVLEKVLQGKADYGFDAKNSVYGSLYKAGVVDPAKVAKSAITNAASVAGLVLTTDVLLLEPTTEAKQQ